jgi:membrane protein YdbS with pleckstrin-like domain
MPVTDESSSLSIAAFTSPLRRDDLRLQKGAPQSRGPRTLWNRLFWPSVLGVMSYVDESLADNERLDYRAHFHWLSKIGAWTILAIFLGVALVCLAIASGLSAWIAAAIMVGLGFAIFTATMMPIWTTEIAVTSHRLIYKRGWLRRTTDELQLTSIEEVNLDQGAIGRLLDFGRLHIHGTGVNDVILPILADPVGLRRALQEAMGAAKVSVAVPEPTVSSQNAA